MQYNTVSRGHRWRIITLIIGIILLVVMLIPGVFPYILRTSGNPEGTFYAENYFPSYSWAGFFSRASFGAVVLCLVFCLVGIIMKRSMTVPVWICNGFALFMIYKIFSTENPLQFWNDGYFLPIVPPILAVAMMVTSLIGLLHDRKK